MMEVSIIELEREVVSEWLSWPPPEVTGAIFEACQRLLPEGTVFRTSIESPKTPEMLEGLVVTGAGVKFIFMQGAGLLIGYCHLKDSEEAEGMFLFLESPMVKKATRLLALTADIQAGPASALHDWMAQFVR
jgi:hypothetical protein